MSDSNPPATPARVPGDAPAGGAPSSSASAASTPTYRARMNPTFGVWAATALVALLFGIAALKSGPTGGAVAFLVVLALEAAFLLSTAPVVEVVDGMFVAGGARIPVTLIGEPVALDVEQWRKAIGPELDPGAFLCMRGWIRTGIRVELNDPEDPTPHWLVAAKQPAQLVDALQAARRAS